MNIHQYLPHKPPMQMVDTITEISQNHVVTAYTVKANGVFVEKEKLAEIGLIENMAQACSAIVGQFLVGENKPLIGYLSTIKKAEIYHLPPVNEVVRTEAQLLSRLDTDTYSLCAMRCQAFCKQTLLATAEMNLVITIS